MKQKLRKRIFSNTSIENANIKIGNVLDLINNAEVLVTSESANNPIDNIVDGNFGKGSSQWIAEVPGMQIIILNFDNPQNIKTIIYETEELNDSRTQETLLEARAGVNQSYSEIHRQEYNFSSSGSTFQREEIRFELPEITSVKMTIKPDKGNSSFTAKLNNIQVIVSYPA